MLLLDNAEQPTISWALDYSGPKPQIHMSVMAKITGTFGLGFSYTGHHHTNDIGYYKDTVADGIALSYLTDVTDPLCYPFCIADISIPSNFGTLTDSQNDLRNQVVSYVNGWLIGNFSRYLDTGDKDDLAINVSNPVALMWSITGSVKTDGTRDPYPKVPLHDYYHLTSVKFYSDAVDPPFTKFDDPTTLVTRTYENCLELDVEHEVYLFWTIDTDRIHLGYTGGVPFSGLGWVSLAWNTNGRLGHDVDANGSFADGWVASLNEDVSGKFCSQPGCLIDIKLFDEASEVPVDTVNDLENPVITKKNGILSAEFQRLLVPTDLTEDHPIKLDGITQLMWAIRTDVDIEAGNTFHLHNELTRGTVAVDFQKGSKCGQVATNEFVNTAGNFKLNFKVSSDQKYLELTMAAQTLGWVSVGWRTGVPKMSGCDTYTGWVDDQTGEVVLIDEWSPDLNQPRRDTQQSVEGITGSQVNGWTSITFKRLLIDGDVKDEQTIARDYYLLWAFHPDDGDKNTLIYPEHTDYGAGSVNFFTGAGSSSVSQMLMEPGELLVIIVMVIIIGYAVIRYLYRCCKWVRQPKHYNSMKSLDEEKERKVESKFSFDMKEGKGADDADLELSTLSSIPAVPKEPHSPMANRFAAKLHQRVPEFLGLQASSLTIITFIAFIVLNIILLFSVDLYEPLATRLGYLCAGNSFLVALPATRNSVLTVLINVSFDQVVMFHRWAGRLLFCLISLHGLLWLLNWNETKLVLATQLFQVDTNLYGFIGYLFAAVLFFSSLEFVRRRFFETFYYFHFSFIGFYLCAVLHTPKCFPYVVAAVSVYLFDRLLRVFWGANMITTTSIQIKPDPKLVNNGNIIIVRFPKDTISKKLKRYGVGQYLFINFPALSNTQWHPFSITSGPDAEYVEVMIRPLGNHTRALMKLVVGESGNEMNQRLWVRVDGPYGGTTTALTHRRFPVAIFVAGGIGITPVLSYLNDIFSVPALKTKPICVNVVHVIWSISHIHCVSWLEDHLKKFNKRAGKQGFPLIHMEIYISKEQIPDGHAEGQFHTLHTGRPQLDKLLAQKVSEGVNGKTEPASVFVCGPNQMVNDAWDAVSTQQRAGLRVDFHHEVFEF